MSKQCGVSCRRGSPKPEAARGSAGEKSMVPNQDSFSVVQFNTVNDEPEAQVEEKLENNYFGYLARCEEDFGI